MIEFQYKYRQVVEITDHVYQNNGAYWFASVEGVHAFDTGSGVVQEVLTLRKLELADHYEQTGIVEYRRTGVIIHMIPAWAVRLAYHQFDEPAYPEQKVRVNR